MNAVILQQTAIRLSQQTRRWDRRLRLVMSVIWLPRGLIVGLLIGLTIAIISRLRPWLLPDQIAIGAGVVLALCGIGTLAAVWGWPRSETRNARFFDVLFDLKERVSTALELTAGLLPMPETLAERQLNDAVYAANNVNVSERLPFQVRAWEWGTVLALGVLLIYLIAAPNPMADEIRSERELDNAINQQIQDLEQAIEDIEANDSLTAEEQAALTQPLKDAQEILQQPNVSQQEAVAAMAEAADQLNEMTDGMSADNEAAYQEAAQPLNQSPMTSDLAQAFQEGELGQASAAMDDLAEKMGQQDLSQEELNDLADQLEQAADAMQETNPALAEKMREIAEALRQGDMEAAQEAAREASDLLQEQQEALENSPSAQAAQTAQEQVEESQRELAQTGQNDNREQPPDQTGNQQQGQQQSQQQEGQQQQGQEQSAQQSDQAQEAEAQQAGQTQAGQDSQQSEQFGQQPGQTGSQSQPGEGDAQTNDAAAGETQDGQMLGESSQGGQSNTDEGQGQGQQDLGGGSMQAGESQGGAGSDNLEGAQSQSSDSIATDNDNSVGGGVEEFQPEFQSSTIGGDSDNLVDVGGDTENDEGETIGEGEFGPNPEGESTLSYTGVYNEYRDVVSSALESGRIPLDQRDVIHDYFSSLDQ